MLLFENIPIPDKSAKPQIPLTREICSEIFVYDPLVGLSRRSNGYKVTGRQTFLKGKYYESKEIAWVLFYGVPPTRDLVAINGDLSDLRLCNLAELPEMCTSITQEWLHKYFTLCGGDLIVKERYCRKLLVGEKLGTATGLGYIMASIGNKHILVHKLVWLYVYGQLPDSDLDHINGIGTDNRIENLRLATKSQNMYNKGISLANTSGYRGVSLSRRDQKWVARITVGDSYAHLGYFKTPQEASAAYEARAAQLHGEFYRPPV